MHYLRYPGPSSAPGFCWNATSSPGSSLDGAWKNGMTLVKAKKSPSILKILVDADKINVTADWSDSWWVMFDMFLQSCANRVSGKELVIHYTPSTKIFVVLGDCPNHHQGRPIFPCAIIGVTLETRLIRIRPNAVTWRNMVSTLVLSVRVRGSTSSVASSIAYFATKYKTNTCRGLVTSFWWLRHPF